jgi:thiazole/oxazole-forming peptide maturase SagD family component
MRQSLDFSDNLNSIISFRKVPFYNDEPKIYQYIAELHDLPQDVEAFRGCGSDISRQAAIHKAVGEAVERTCLQQNKALPLLRCTASDMPHPFIEPQRFQPYSDKQLKSESFRWMRFSKDTTFSWTVGLDALTEQETWLPAQLVFCPYDLSSEPAIRFPSSNGTAFGHTLTEARCRAILEVFERDTFMCWYLAAMPASLISIEDLRQDEDIVKISSMYERYRLDLRILLLPSRWAFPVVLALIIDDTGAGPGLRAGLKCHPHLSTAIKGAVSEAQQMRPWLRDHIELYGLPQSIKKSDIIDSWSRALFWARPNQYQEISDLWTSISIKEHDKAVGYSPMKEIDWEALWNLLLSNITKVSADLFLVDISGNIGRTLEANVVKAVIPQAHPMYMDERYPYLRSDNLIFALDTFGPRWSSGQTDYADFEFPPHPFS